MELPVFSDHCLGRGPRTVRRAAPRIVTRPSRVNSSCPWVSLPPVDLARSLAAHQKMSARGRQTTAKPIANTTAKAHASMCRMPPATNPSAWKARHARNINGVATSISSASGQTITNRTPSANSTNRSFSIFVDLQPHTLKYEFEARRFPPSTQSVVVQKAIFSFRETDF